uniref:Uncharacterized protein n=1 Tax=Vespula pensylvanica TaxID=30213 RepID=A0A834N0E2_VESPE|nr:hypothetical protein H0235_018052 [Vespula pensylvanica]
MEWSIISIQEQTTTSISVNVVKVDSCPLEPQYVGASSAHSLFLLRALTTALEHSLRATQNKFTHQKTPYRSKQRTHKD